MEIRGLTTSAWSKGRDLELDSQIPRERGDTDRCSNRRIDREEARERLVHRCEIRKVRQVRDYADDVSARKPGFSQQPVDVLERYGDLVHHAARSIRVARTKPDLSSQENQVSGPDDLRERQTRWLPDHYLRHDSSTLRVATIEILFYNALW